MTTYHSRRDVKNMTNFWDFKGVHRTGIHTLGHYPATMVPEMQLGLMQTWSKKEYKVMLDPFMGSGTALIEAQKLGLNTIGIDLNPYAVLLSEVKTHDYSETNWAAVITRIFNKLNEKEYLVPIFDFNKINKWFRKDIILSLSRIRNVIKSENDIWIRKFLWVCMSETIYSHSNDRTSSFKLHVKFEEQIEAIPDNAIKDFLKIVSHKCTFLSTHELPTAKIYAGDAKEACTKIATESVDMICTSPPYGDSATTVTYGQASILFLKWIDKKDLESRNLSKLLSNFSAIDSLSLGGRVAAPNGYSSKLLENFLANIAPKKCIKVKRFFSDYWIIIQQMARVLDEDGTIIITLGNRTVDNQVQPLDQITIEMFAKLGIKHIKTYSRHIEYRRTPQHVNLQQNGCRTRSLDSERTLIFRRKTK
ncbi:DNA methyltransferase [Lactobacillus huangpiensis]